MIRCMYGRGQDCGMYNLKNLWCFLQDTVCTQTDVSRHSFKALNEGPEKVLGNIGTSKLQVCKVSWLISGCCCFIIYTFSLHCCTADCDMFFSTILAVWGIRASWSTQEWAHRSAEWFCRSAFSSSIRHLCLIGPHWKTRVELLPRPARNARGPVRKYSEN